jgi:hypothetical protein
MPGRKCIGKRRSLAFAPVPTIATTVSVTASEQALGLAWCSMIYQCGHTVGASLAGVFARHIIGNIRLRAI